MRFRDCASVWVAGTSGGTWPIMSLSTFDPDERETILAATLRAADAAEMFLADGIERVMNTFNAAMDNEAG